MTKITTSPDCVLVRQAAPAAAPAPAQAEGWQVAILRSALVELVGADGREELEQMEAVLRRATAPAEDITAAINGIHALIKTLPPSAPDAETP